jgi:uncharacterized lipoprotein YddW (UPF0748 family)
MSRPLIAAVTLAALTAGTAYTFGPTTRPKGAKTASTATTASCRTSAHPAKRQLRGVWIATVHNIDWPSRTGLTPAQQQAEYLAILDAAVRRRLNAVFLQVRPASDAFYRSELEPWSQYLTGSPGKDPGWDPLPFLVAEAHKRGLEFHAWFNPYRAAYTANTSDLPDSHPARVHPEWTVKHEGRLYYNPGLPEVRGWVNKVIKDVVQRYDVDGIHFDDYFYPYPGKGTKFNDSAAFKKYGKGKDLGDWRRENINTLVAEVSETVHGTKPHVKFGISPFGIWRNKSNDPAGSDTRGMSAYDSIYADAKAWIKAGSVDYVMPQLYWPRGFAVADYDVLVPWWANAVKGTDVDLYIGQALYRVGTKDNPSWKDPRELPSHLAFNRKHPGVKGDVYFSAAQLVRNPLKVMDRIARNHYAKPALLPLITNFETAAPPAPKGLKASGGSISWKPRSAARGYAIYRVDGTGGKRDLCATADARNLVAVIPASDAPSYTPSASGTFYVTTLDRLHNEGPAARVRFTLP